MRVEIGKMCHKGNGHLAIIGENDFGACGSHYYASVYIELPEELIAEDGDEFPERAKAAGLELGRQLNEREDMMWELDGLKR